MCLDLERQVGCKARSTRQGRLSTRIYEELQAIQLAGIVNI